MLRKRDTHRDSWDMTARDWLAVIMIKIWSTETALTATRTVYGILIKAQLANGCVNLCVCVCVCVLHHMKHAHVVILTHPHTLTMYVLSFAGTLWFLWVHDLLSFCIPVTVNTPQPSVHLPPSPAVFCTDVCCCTDFTVEICLFKR